VVVGPLCCSILLAQELLPELKPLVLDRGILEADELRSVIMSWVFVFIAKYAVDRLVFVVGAVLFDTDEYNLLSSSTVAELLGLRDSNHPIQLARVLRASVGVLGLVAHFALFH